MKRPFKGAGSGREDMVAVILKVSLVLIFRDFDG